MLCWRINAPQFCCSSFNDAANCAGVSNTGSSANCSSLAALAGNFTALAISFDSRCTSAGGTLAGAITENAVKALMPPKPASVKLGTPGSKALLSVMDSASNLPASMNGRTLPGR